MKTLSEKGMINVRLMIAEDKKIRNKALHDLSLTNLFNYYIDRWHRRRCSICGKLYSELLMHRAGIGDYND